jgi:3-hydroxymyristoyl/3-hydroxydecanoyl-(acyl carrier protein) dehydratase
MSHNIHDKNIAQSGLLPACEEDQFVLGADVITYIITVKYPMIMVDKIISYHSNPLSLTAERYISANEPVFVGHFPSVKLWPGVYTLEGLRQACFILQVLRELEKADLLKGLIELHNRQMLRPKINHELCQRVIDYLKTGRMHYPDIFSIRVKLLEPVFPGSLIKYHVLRDDKDFNCWSVSAAVDERLIAKGTIIQSFSPDFIS